MTAAPEVRAEPEPPPGGNHAEASSSDERTQTARHLLAGSVPRRWIMSAAGVALLVAGRGSWDLAVPPLAVLGVAAGLTGANLAFAVLSAAQRFRTWMVYVAVAFDGLFAAAVVATVGHGGMAVVFLVATIPYSTGRLRIPGDLLPVLGGGAYLGATAIHGLWLADAPVGAAAIPPMAYWEAAALVLTGVVLRRTVHRLLARIGVTRGILTRVANGGLDARAPAAGADEFSQLERALNEALDGIGSAIGGVQREAQEVAALAELMSLSVQSILSASETVASTAATLAEDMENQRRRAEDGQRQSSDAAAEAGGLEDRAEAVATDAQHLLEAAEGGRERVFRAGETLLAISEDVRTTARSVQLLSEMSERIGAFAHTILRISRQTHVLALNAAIEAAHSGQEREGFSAVAEEVRELAAQADRSAREAAEIIDDLRSRIGAVARAMASGQEQVRDVGVVAGEAQAALDQLVSGAVGTNELVGATARISRSQAARMSALATQMAEIARISANSATQAESASAAMARQRATLEDLSSISRQLAGLADRLRSTVGRFAVGPHAGAP